MRARTTPKEGVREREGVLQGRSCMCVQMRVRAKNQQQHVRIRESGESNNDVV